MPHKPQTTTAALIAEFSLRHAIVEEHHLRAEIARDKAMQSDEPARWRLKEAQRLARNREQSELNRHLRAAGCRPIEPELSLGQELKKLQQLEARNRAEIATRQHQAAGFAKKSGGHAIRSAGTGRARHGRGK